MEDLNIVVDGWGDIAPPELRYKRAAGEPEPKPYRSKYPYAVVFFAKLKKEYHKEQLAEGLKPKVLVDAEGKRFELNALDKRTLKPLDKPERKQSRRAQGIVSIDW